MTIVTADAGAGNISEGAYLLDLSTLSDRELELLELYTGMLGLSTTDHSSEELSVLIGRYLYHCSASWQG
jgi:hypothetical protein